MTAPFDMHRFLFGINFMIYFINCQWHPKLSVLNQLTVSFTPSLLPFITMLEVFIFHKFFPSGMWTAFTYHWTVNFTGFFVLISFSFQLITFSVLSVFERMHRKSSHRVVLCNIYQNKFVWCFDFINAIPLNMLKIIQIQNGKYREIIIINKGLVIVTIKIFIVLSL